MIRRPLWGPHWKWNVEMQLTMQNYEFVKLVSTFMFGQLPNMSIVSRLAILLLTLPRQEPATEPLFF